MLADGECRHLIEKRLLARIDMVDNVASQPERPVLDGDAERRHSRQLVLRLRHAADLRAEPRMPDEQVADSRERGVRLEEDDVRLPAAVRVVDALIREFAGLRSARAEMVRVLAALDRHPEYRRMMFSPQALPLTFSLMRRYPEFCPQPSDGGGVA